MDDFIARANIDHYLDLLKKDDISCAKRSTIGKLLADEENKLSHNMEQLEFTERRLAACRDQLNHLQRLREHFVEGSTERIRTQAIIASLQGILLQMERFCCFLRQKVQASRL